MRILFCCEFYSPSKGGVQKVMQEIAERLVKRGHHVDVATTRLAGRCCPLINGVKIHEFEISGNIATGLKGEVKRFQDFLVFSSYDVLMVKAAQQWTFDAMWPVLPEIKAKKVHIPCGYSGLYDPAYSDYFKKMPAVLKRFDRLIYYSNNYRDINFARKHNIENYFIIPNGASEIEFKDYNSGDFRKLLGIPEDDFVFLTVGSPPFMKGHLEVALAYKMLELPFSSTLILNGCYSDCENPFTFNRKGYYKEKLRKNVKLILRLYHPTDLDKFFKTIKSINKQPRKKVIICNLPREDVISAFFESDLFLFASHIEYSPLVLFEAAAAGLPFLSASVGNAEEICKWTQSGIVYPVKTLENGYSPSDPKCLADHIKKLTADPDQLKTLGIQGRQNWSRKFTWEAITNEYEKIFEGIMKC